MKNKLSRPLALILLSLAILTTGASPQPAKVVRGFYFPNITHTQALVGTANGTFEKELGTKVEWQVFNAGPSAIEALFAGQLDIGYIGPNPAINGFVKSEGTALKIIAGATSGGAALVVRDAAGIKNISDFHGRKIASPQMGNTQDIALRHWLRANGLKTKEQGGDIEIVPIANPDQLTLFLKKEIDAAWAPEPWVTRLVQEGGGRIFLDERALWPQGRFATAVLIVSQKFLADNRPLVVKWLKANQDLTDWIRKNPLAAQKIVGQRLKELTGKSLPAEVIAQAFGRLEVTTDPMIEPTLKAADYAYEEGFLGKSKPDLSGLYDLDFLKGVPAKP